MQEKIEKLRKIIEGGEIFKFLFGSDNAFNSDFNKLFKCSC